MTASLIDNLPLLAGAPNGTKKLRELILELAVRGKLVPQDPSDEPASELLKRIAEEKARLVAEGKIKKQKPLAEVDEAVLPFELPAAWVWTRLGEVTNFGTTTKKGEIPDDAWVLDLEDIEKDTSRLLQKARFYERNSLSDKNSFTKGDVLYGKLRPYLNKVLVAEDDGFCTTEILPFRCHGPFVARYFMVAMKSPYFLSYVNAKSYGMKMPRLGTEDGRHACFPLPPLAEQHRIVAKVDELMALCDRLEARQADADSAHAQLVQELLDSLAQARDAEDFAQSWQRLAAQFHTLFTTESSIDALKQTLLQLAVMGKLVPQDPNDEPAREVLKRIAEEKARRVAEGKVRKQKPLADIGEGERPFDIPASWEWARLGELGLVGSSSRVHQKDWQTSGVPFYRAREIVRLSKDGFVENELFISEELYQELSTGESAPKVGDIMLTGVGTIGVPYCVQETDRFYFKDASVLIFKNHLADNSSYLLRYFVSPLWVETIHAESMGTTVHTLTIARANETLCPLPPLAEQHRIVAKVDELMALCDQVKARLNQARQVHEQLASALVERAVA